eukprot:153163-Chlamydomonas_euryale.AAC.1
MHRHRSQAPCHTCPSLHASAHARRPATVPAGAPPPGPAPAFGTRPINRRQARGAASTLPKPCGLRTV